MHIKCTPHKYFIMFTFPRGAKFVFQLYACNLSEIYVLSHCKSHFLRSYYLTCRFYRKINTELGGGGGELLLNDCIAGCPRCFDTCEHDANGNGKLFSIARLENDGQCQFIIVSAYVSVTESVTCLLSIQISSVKHWTDIELRD